MITVIVIIIIFIVAFNLLHSFEQMTSLTDHVPGLYGLSLLTKTDLNSHLLGCVLIDGWHSYSEKQPDIDLYVTMFTERAVQSTEGHVSNIKCLMLMFNIKTNALDG